MPTTAPPRPKETDAPPAARSPSLHRFTVDDYYAMAEAGVLQSDARVELIHGQILDMSPIGVKHGKVVNRLNALLSRRVAAPTAFRAMVSVQNPVRVDDGTEPEPDLALISLDAPEDRHPGPEEVLLIVEVAGTSLDYDRDVKGSLYANAGIGEYWLVDLEGECVDVHREPDGDSYARRIRYRRGDAVDIEALPDADPLEVEHVLDGIPREEKDGGEEDGEEKDGGMEG